MSKIGLLFLLLPLLHLNGCGDPNKEAVFASHPIGQSWLDSGSANFHGDASELATANCTECHGSDYLGGSSGVSCDNCHFGPNGDKVPSGSNWNHGDTPHDSLSAEAATCNACHSILRSYGDGPNSCHDCHGGAANHATGEQWLNPSINGYHGDVAEQSAVSCQACHGSNYLGGSSGVSCSECHFGPSGSKVPPGVNWNHGFSNHDNREAYETTCNRCHTLLRSYGDGPNSCHNCH